jgi:hypothetical protein
MPTQRHGRIVRAHPDIGMSGRIHPSADPIVPSGSGRIPQRWVPQPAGMVAATLLPPGSDRDGKNTDRDPLGSDGTGTPESASSAGLSMALARRRIGSARPAVTQRTEGHTGRAPTSNTRTTHTFKHGARSESVPQARFPRSTPQPKPFQDPRGTRRRPTAHPTTPVEPPVGIEPTTYALRGRRATAQNAPASTDRTP